MGRLVACLRQSEGAIEVRYLAALSALRPVIQIVALNGH
jgi:hypothetical protein